MKKLILIFNLFITFYSTAQSNKMDKSADPEKIVKDFLLTVRSGNNPDKAKEFMADSVLAHQINSENLTTVIRTPKDYAEHVKGFLEAYGKYTFEITELITENNKVYARWKQTGTHLTKIDGYAPTGRELVEIASAVYRVKDERIVEYWIQIDRYGFDKQLKLRAE